MTASAQKEGDKKPPPKEKPPVIVVEPKTPKPKDDKPKDDKKKPQAFIFYFRNEWFILVNSKEKGDLNI